MWIIFKLLVLILFHIRNGNTNSVFQSRITAVKYPEQNSSSISCDCSKEDCESINCELCLYAKLFNWNDVTFGDNNLIARAQLIYNTLIDEFKPTIVNSFTYEFYYLRGVAIFVNKCASGDGYIIVDMFIHNYLDSRFFIKCNYCLGFYRNYRLGGILLNNENSIAPTKSIAFEITYIEFLHQKLQSKSCCSSELNNTFDECNVCKFWIAMELNERPWYDTSIKEFDSFTIQHKLNYRYFFKLTDWNLRPLKVRFYLYQQQANTIIDSFGPYPLETFGYYKNKFAKTGDGLNVKANFSYTLTPIGFVGGNGNSESRDVPKGTTFNIDGSLSCADPTRTLPNCDSENGAISYCNVKKPCKNNGKCSGTVAGYKCECEEGFYGKNCEFFYCKQPCITGKCVSGNLCGYCYPGFGGERCGEKVCDGYNKCIHGNCSIDINNQRYCKCSANYSGNYCQYNCYLPCVQGVCKFVHGISFCLCNFGWNGVLCESPADTKSEIFHTSRNFIILIVIIPVIVFGLIILIFFLILKVIHVRVNINKDELHDKILTLMATTQNNDNLKTSIPSNKIFNDQNQTFLGKNTDDSNGLIYKVYEDFSLNRLEEDEIKFNELPENINDKGLNNDATKFNQKDSKPKAELQIL